MTTQQTQGDVLEGIDLLAPIPAETPAATPIPAAIQQTAPPTAIPVVPTPGPTAPASPQIPATPLQGIPLPTQVSPLAERERRELEQYRQQQVAFDIQRRQSELETEVKQQRRVWEQQVTDPYALDQMENLYRTQRGAVIQTQQQAMAFLNGEMRKREVINEVAGVHNLSPDQTRRLERFNREEDIRLYAADVAGVQKELQILKDQMGKLQQRQVPEQHFAGGGQGEGVTSDNIDALWIAGRVSDEQYRAFLRRQEG